MHLVLKNCSAFIWFVACFIFCDGAFFELTAIDSCSAFGYLADTRTHTQPVWLLFCKHFVLYERKIGHTAVITLRFDRAPELSDQRAFDMDTFRAELHELRVLVELAPRNRSQGVAAASSR